MQKYSNPFQPPDRVLALQRCLDALKRQEPLPYDLGHWFAFAIRAYLDGQVDMDRALGLLAHGKRRPKTEQKLSTRNEVMVVLCAQLSGLPPRKRVRVGCAIFNGEQLPPNAAVQSSLDSLREFENVPKSLDQWSRIVVGLSEKTA